MKYSNTAIKELSAKYRSILKKCAFLNATILLGVALPAGAYVFPTDGSVVSGEIAEMNVVLSGRTVNFENVTASNMEELSYSGAAIENLGTSTITGKSEFKNNSAPNGGVIYNTGNMTVGGTFTANEAASWGGSIYNAGNLTVSDNTIFNNNKAGSVGGAITNALGTSVLTLGSNITFTDNEAINDGGAIGNYKGATLVNGTTFVGNKAQTGTTDTNAIGGGAMSLGAESTTNIANATFSSNESGFNGGAIGTRNALSASNSAATLDITNSVFTGNKATGTVTSTFSYGSATGGNGGALDNHFYNSETKVGYAYISSSTFTRNEAVYGGAISNNGTADRAGNVGKLYLENSTFSDNTATTAGGALYNEGVIDLAGTNTFSGNKVASALNDIHNLGTLNVAGNLTLDGGISGAGDMLLADGVLLTAKAGTTTIENNIINEGTSKLALTFANGFSADTYQLVTGSLDNEFEIQENSLYSILAATTKGTYSIAKKSTDEVVDNLMSGGASAQEAATISAIADTAVDNPVLNKITELVQTGDVKTAAKAAQDLAPTTSQAVMGVSKDLTGMMANVAGGRMSALSGRAGGDVFKGGSMWVQGLYNHTKQDATSASEGFKANSAGVALGIDGKLNDAWTIGLGYGYTRTNADAGARDIDVDGNNVFTYAEYSPDAWYVNGVLNFGYGRYTEKKAPAGYTMKSKYDVYTYGANVMTGYAFKTGLTPEGGLRYLLIDQKSYTDGVEKISTKNNDVLTAVLGAKYGYAVKTKDWTFTPNVRLAATYDLMSDGSRAIASITGGNSYQIAGERLHRFGMEAGVGFASTWNNWDFTLSYDGGFRKDYQSHTGVLKAKYHF